MVECSIDRVYTEHVVLDIGEGIGSLVIYTSEKWRGKEIQVSLKGVDAAKLVHTAVWERRFNGRVAFAGVYAALPEGDYIIWTHPSKEVTIAGGHVAEADLRDISDIYVPYPNHAHASGGAMERDLLPPRYRNGKVVSISQVGEDSDVMIISQYGKIIRTETKQIREAGRSTQGVRLLHLEAGDKGAATSLIAPEEPNGNGDPTLLQ